MLNYVGLLTDAQKRAEYFVVQNEDFIFLFKADGNGKAQAIAVFPYETARVKEIRGAAVLGEPLRP
jgi:hypothetical protein